MQEALPREMYVDEATWRVERETVLFGEWFCVGRRDALGLSVPSRVVVVDVAGESVLVTSDEAGELHASYNVCRHRGSQILPATTSGVSPTACQASALRCPYHSWTYGLDGRLLKAPHADLEDTSVFALSPVGVEAWGGFVFVHLSPEQARPLAESVARAAGTLTNYGLADLAVGAAFRYDVAANYKVILENYNECYHCGPVHPELCRLVPSFAGGGDSLDWEAGIPHREGAWTFTTTGTTTRAPLPGLDEDERTRHKGDLVYPNLMVSASADHVAAFVLLPDAPDHTTIECSLLFAADAVAAGDFDPSDAGDLWDLVNRQDWAVCESVQRGMSSRSYRHGWFAPMEDDSLDIRRWLLPRLGWVLVSTQVDYVVAGLGALGSATAYELASRGHRVIGLERFELGHANGASHDTSRILRHSYHTPAYVRLTCDAYADWARLEQASGRSLVTKVGGLDLFPPHAAIPPVDYVDSLREVGIEHEVLDAGAVAERWPQFELASDVMALYQRDAAIVPAGLGTRTLQEQAARSGADLRPHSPVTGVHDLGAGGIEVATADGTIRCRGLVVCADAWVNDVLRHLGVNVPVEVTLEQVTYFQPPEPTRFAPERMPLWIWMDDPSYYGFPSYGEATIKAAQDCGGPIVDPDDRTSERDSAMEERLASFVADLLPGSGEPVRSLRCQYTLTPDRDFVIAPVPGHESVVVGLGAAHGFKFAPTLGRLLADLVVDGGTGTDLADFRLDRPALTDPAYAAHWLV